MIQRFCMGCGKPLREGDKFCLNCGTPVGSVPLKNGKQAPRKAGQQPPLRGPVPQQRPQGAPRQATAVMPPQRPPVPSQVPARPQVPTQQRPMGAPQPKQQPSPQQWAPAASPQGQRGMTQPWQRPAGAAAAPQGGAPRVPYVPPTGDEITSVLDEDMGHGMGNDEQTTVLASTLQVTLERKRTGETYQLNLPCVVGKGSAADCRIPNNTAISRRHVRISSDETTGGAPHVVVEDLGSLNKSQLNGDPLKSGIPRALLDGDLLTLADESFLVHVREI